MPRLFGPRATAAVLALLSLADRARAEPPGAEPAGTSRSEVPPASPARGDAAPRGSTVTSRLARAAVAVALRAAGHAEMRRELSGMASRARVAALAPELSLRALRSMTDSLSLTPTADDPSHYSLLGGAGLVLEARLAWHLDRLIYGHDEVMVARLRDARSDAAERLAARVLSVLFAWQRSGLRARDTTLLADERDEAALAHAEAEVTLDVLTGGWFTAKRPD